MNPASTSGSGPAASMADGRAAPNATSSVTAPASSHCGSSGWQSHSARSVRAVMAAQTWTASAAGSAIAAARAATAASTACDSAHWRTRAGSAVNAAEHGRPGYRHRPAGQVREHGQLRPRPQQAGTVKRPLRGAHVPQRARPRLAFGAAGGRARLHHGAGIARPGRAVRPLAGCRP